MKVPSHQLLSIAGVFFCFILNKIFVVVVVVVVVYLVWVGWIRWMWEDEQGYFETRTNAKQIPKPYTGDSLNLGVAGSKVYL